jgi:hypothetical protein
MKPELKASEGRVYDAIFHDPPAGGVDWRRLRSLLSALDAAVEEHRGNVRFTLNGQTLVLDPPADKHRSEVKDVTAIRDFLTRAGAGPDAAAAEDTRLLVVIDHRQARVYRAEGRGAAPHRITPYDPGGFGRNLRYVQDRSNGQRKPERKSFYDAVAKTLQGADRVLLFGGGTGASSAMDHLLSELKEHHPEIAKHVVGTVVVDASHLSEDQLLAKAREFWAMAASESAAPQRGQGRSGSDG